MRVCVCVCVRVCACVYVGQLQTKDTIHWSQALVTPKTSHARFRHRNTIADAHCCCSTGTLARGRSHVTLDWLVALC
jgi:hypothetical protein